MVCNPVDMKAPVILVLDASQGSCTVADRDMNVTLGTQADNEGVRMEAQIQACSYPSWS